MADQKRILDDLGDFLDKALANTLKKQGKESSGALMQSFRHVVRFELDKIVVEGQMLFYGEFVDKGRKPGAKGVPVQALIDWLKRKKIESDITKAKSMAFAIQKKIKADGIKPTNFVENMLTENAAKIEAMTTIFLGEFVETELDTIFKQLQ